MIQQGQSLSKDNLNRAYISKTATGTQILLGSLKLSGGITVDGDGTFTNVRTNGGTDSTWGSAYLTNKAVWGTSFKHPTLTSYGGNTGGMIMIENPHLPYTTNNNPTGYTGKAAIRMATDAAATNFWDMGVYSGDRWVISRSNTVFLNISSNGNTGIGVTDPAYLLSVGNANHRFNMNPHGAGMDFHSTGNIAFHYQTDFSLYTGTIGAGIPKFYMDSNSSTIIGPSRSVRGKLHVLGTNVTWGSSPAISIDPNTDTNADLVWATQDVVKAAISVRGSSENNNFTIHTHDGANWYNRLTIDRGSGNVGIGTASPDVKLHIVGNGTKAAKFDGNVSIHSKSLNFGEGLRLVRDRADSAWAHLSWHNYDTDNSVDARWALGIGSHSDPSGRDQNLTLLAATKAFGAFSGYHVDTIQIWNYGTGEVYMKGNVGIGTITPGAKLHVAGDTYVDGKTFLKGGSGWVGAPLISLAIGDNDTGFNWVADGKLQLYVNNIPVAEYGDTYFQVNKDLRVATNLFYTNQPGGSYREGGVMNLLTRLRGRILNINPDFLMNSVQGTIPTNNIPYGYNIYDNNTSDRVRIYLVADDMIPNASGLLMRIDYDPARNASIGTAPGYGGFNISFGRSTGPLNLAGYRAGNRYIYRIIAKIPVGRNIKWASNGYGDGGGFNWISSLAGTGDWQEYIGFQTIGITGTFGGTCFFYIDGGADAAFTWDVSQVQVVGMDEVADVDRAPYINVGYKPNVQLGWGDLYVTGNTRTDGYISTNNYLQVNKEAVGYIWTNGSSSITVDHPTSGGASSMVFRSRSNALGEGGYILMQDNSAMNWGSTAENVRMTLGVFNDFRQAGSSHSDEMWFQGGGRLVYNVGLWDSELNTLVGTPGAGTTGGHEWRVNNNVQMVLDHSGHLTMNGRLWVGFGNNNINGYSWVDAAITTNSIEIVNNNAADSTKAPTLAFHYYGYGGPQFRLSADGNHVLFLESANANSARNPNAYGGGSNTYFSKFFVDGQLQTSGNVGIGINPTGSKVSIAGNSSTPALQVGNSITFSTLEPSGAGAGNDRALVIRNLGEFRFTDANTWSWDDWAGIKYETASQKLYIGGSSSSAFSKNSGVSSNVVFDGVVSLTINNTAPLIMNGGYLQYNIVGTAGGWARGFVVNSTDGATTHGGSGMYGVGSTPYHLYLAHGASPWASGTGIYVLPSGNVGVGITSPTSRFHVNNSGSTAQAFYVDAGNFSGTQTLFNHTGASTPVPFEIRKSGAGGGEPTYGILQLHMDSITYNSGANLYFTALSADSSKLELAGIGGVLIDGGAGVQKGDLVMYTAHNGAVRSEKMRIRWDGNVGIGTSNPLQKLHIEGSIRGNDSGGRIKIQTDTGWTTIGSGNTDWSHFDTDRNNFYFGKPIQVNGTIGSYNTWDLHLQTNGTTRIFARNSDGFVGINTTSPAAMFHVLGGVKIGPGTDASVPASGNIQIGDSGVDYTPTNGNWTTTGSTLLLNAANYSTIAFHDAGNRVDFIRVGAGTMTLGYDGGWGSSSVIIPNALSIGRTGTPGYALDIVGAGYASTQFLSPRFNLGAATDYINNAPWYGVGSSNLTQVGSGGVSTQLAGYWGVNIKTSNNELRVGYLLDYNALLFNNNPVYHGGNLQWAGTQVNYANPAGWTAGQGAGVGYWGGNFTTNGSDAESTRAYADTPHTSPGLLWESIDNDTSSDGDGGWNKTITGLDPNKTYRSVVWFRRNSAAVSGNFYHGCSSNDTLNLDGTNNDNPYFYSGSISNFTQGEWYLSVGYVHANNDGSTTHYGGVYRKLTGEKAWGVTDYKMKAGSTQQIHRTYIYYSTDPAVRVDWWGPRFEEVNGNEPSIGALLGQIPKPKFQGLNVIGTDDRVVTMRSDSNASNNNPAFLFVNTYSNRAWGAVAEFRTESGGADRPSIVFSSSLASTTWSVGYAGNDDNFRIVKNHGMISNSWGTPALTIDPSLNATFAGILTTSGVTTTSLTSTGLSELKGSLNVASNINASNYYDAAIEVRELNMGGVQDDTWAVAPRIGFHWGGRVANQLAMSSNGRLHWRNGDASGTADFEAGRIYANDWVRTYGQTGWYSETYGGGIYMIDSTWVRVSHTKQFWVDGAVMATAGSLGVGRSDPQEKLHVMGNAKIEGNITVTGTIGGSGVPNTGKYRMEYNATDDSLDFWYTG